MKTLSRSIEITIISAEDLRIHGRPIKNNAFVAVQTASDATRSTSVDTTGGNYPSWNEMLELPLPREAQFVRVEVQCRTSSGTKAVAGAHVPVSDFAGGWIPDGYLTFLSYRLRKLNGERNGIINLSIRVKGKGDVASSMDGTYFSSSSSSSCGGGGGGGGVAIGVPVMWGKESRIN
ncbi:hypothetical protein Sjap_020630 [Stephania japonica]|uniref:C2 domain-containing protein n=1 Tax=Stephania japonica TaxID=461633 RepID=A0AAP0F2B0_9MAGN